MTKPREKDDDINDEDNPAITKGFWRDVIKST
jgi:hypothetical protein